MFDAESAMTNAIDGQGAKPVAAARICRLSASKLYHQSGVRRNLSDLQRTERARESNSMMDT